MTTPPLLVPPPHLVPPPYEEAAKSADYVSPDYETATKIQRVIKVYLPPLKERIQQCKSARSILLL
jgi:hypothetical protein